MRSNKPERVGEILARLKQTTALGRQLDQAKVWEHWGEVAGTELFQHTRPHRIKQDTLYIEADSAVWMHKAAYHKWEIIERINRLVGYGLIGEVFVTLSPEADPPLSQYGG